MNIIKPFGPSIGRTKISNRFFAILNKEGNSEIFCHLGISSSLLSSYYILRALKFFPSESFR